MDLDALAHNLRLRLLEADPATVFAVHADGSIAAQSPGIASFAGIDRRRRPLATFTASHLPPVHAQIVARLEQGLRKQAAPSTLAS